MPISNNYRERRFLRTWIGTLTLTETMYRIYLTALVSVLILAACEPGAAVHPPDTEGDVVKVSDVRRIVYGAPVGVEAGYPVSWAFPSEISSDDQIAIETLPVVTLGLTEVVMASSTWPEAIEGARDYLADPKTQVDGLKGYIVDQTVVQIMLFHSDLLESTSTPKRLDTLREYLGILVKNRYPDPDAFDQILTALGDEIGPSERVSAAQAALDAFSHLRMQFQPVRERCPACYDAVVQGENPRAIHERSESLTRLTAKLAIDQRSKPKHQSP